MIPLVFFGVGVSVLSIIAFVVNSNFHSGVATLSCDVESGYVALMSGTQASNGYTWSGLQNIAYQLQLLSGDIENFTEDTSNVFQNAGYLTTAPGYFLNNINQIYNNSIDFISTLPNPNYYTTTDDSDINTIFADGMSLPLGPNISQTWIYNLSVDFGSYQENWTNLLIGVNYTSNTLTSNTSSLQTVLQASNNISNLSNTLINYSSSILNATSTVRSSTQTTNQIIFGFYLAILLTVLIAIIAGIVVSCVNIKGFRILLHIVWILLMLITMLSFILLIILVPFSYVSLQGCGALSQMLSSSSGYAEYTTIFNIGQFVNETSTCFFNDSNNGSLANSFDFNNSIQLLNNLTIMLNMLSSLQTLSLQDSSSLNNITLLASNLTGILNFTLYADATPTSSPDYIVNVLNSATLFADWNLPNSNQTNNAKCNVSQDIFILNPAGCPSGEFQLTNSNVTANFGLPTCVNPYVAFSSYSGDPNYWGIRYSNASYNSCSLFYDPSASPTELDYVILDYVNSIWSYEQAVLDNFTPLNTSVAQYNSLLASYTNNLSSLTNNLTNFTQSFQNISNIVSNRITGLYYGTNCTLIGAYMRQMYSDFCSSVVPELTMLTTVTIVFAFFLWVTAISAFFLAMRNIHSADDDDEENVEKATELAAKNIPDIQL